MRKNMVFGFNYIFVVHLRPSVDLIIIHFNYFQFLTQVILYGFRRLEI